MRHDRKVGGEGRAGNVARYLEGVERVTIPATTVT
jgi:hypothetical protein